MHSRRSKQTPRMNRHRQTGSDLPSQPLEPLRSEVCLLGPSSASCTEHSCVFTCHSAHIRLRSENHSVWAFRFTIIFLVLHVSAHDQAAGARGSAFADLVLIHACLSRCEHVAKVTSLKSAACPLRRVHPLVSVFFSRLRDQVICFKVLPELLLFMCHVAANTLCSDRRTKNNTKSRTNCAPWNPGGNEVRTACGRFHSVRGTATAKPAHGFTQFGKTPSWRTTTPFGTEGFSPVCVVLFSTYRSAPTGSPWPSSVLRPAQSPAIDQAHRCRGIQVQIQSAGYSQVPRNALDLEPF